MAAICLKVPARDCILCKCLVFFIFCVQSNKSSSLDYALLSSGQKPINLIFEFKNFTPVDIFLITYDLEKWACLQPSFCYIVVYINVS